MDPRNPLRSHDVAQYFSKAQFDKYQAEEDSVKIPFVRLHARSDHGLALADELGRANGKRKRFIVTGLRVLQRRWRRLVWLRLGSRRWLGRGVLKVS